MPASANLPKCPEQRFANDRQLDLDQWRISELYAICLLSEVARSGSAQAVPSRRPDVEILAAVKISTGSLDLCQQKAASIQLHGRMPFPSDSGIAHALKLSAH
jgi:hypothetical protein